MGDSSPAPSTEPSITLHSSWTGITMSYAGGFLLLVLSIGLVATSGLNLGTGIVLAIAVVFAAVVLFDLPIAAEFRRDGVVRRALLRKQFMPWEQISRLRRLRVGLLGTRPGGRGGGLVAVVKRRQYILVDTMESAIEYDDLRRLLGERAEPLGLTGDLRPPDGRSPTWLYRTDRWKPESAQKARR